jgi:hypothetical protein
LVIQETFGLYSLSMKLKTTKSPKSISTKILKTKPFPVINGKKKVEGTIKGIKGTRSKPPKIKYSIIFFMNGVYQNDIIVASKGQKNKVS